MWLILTHLREVVELFAIKTIYKLLKICFSWTDLRSSIQCESKKQSPVYFTVVSAYVDRCLQYLAQSIMRKYTKQKLLICPPHLHNAAALSWEKLIFGFSILNLVFFGSMRVALKTAGFLVLI